MSAVAFLFVGPSLILNFSNSLVIMGIGQSLVGIFTATMMIPGLPEMVESTLPLFPGQEQVVNDLSSGVFNAFLGLGQVFAPMYGSTVKDLLGFRLTCDIVALICFVFGLFYFLIGGGIEAFRNTAANIKKARGGDDQYERFVDNKSINTTLKSGDEKNTSITVPVPTTFAVSRLRLHNASSLMSSDSTHRRIRSRV